MIVHSPLVRTKSNLRVVTASVSGTVIAGWSGNSEAGIALFFVLNGWSVTSKRITLLVWVKSWLFLGEVLSRSMVVPGGYAAKSMTTSYRSAAPCRKLATRTGAGISPASVAMTAILAPLDSDHL